MTQWLEERKRGITGSDIAYAVSRNANAMVVARKLGILSERDFTDDENVEWGTILEPVVLQQLEKRTGRELIPPEQWAEAIPSCDVLVCEHDDGPKILLVNKDAPHMRCTPDGFMRAWKPLRNIASQIEQPGIGLVECKTANAFREGEWATQAPLYARIQLHWGMMVTGLRWGCIPGVIGGNRWRVYDRIFDEQAAAFLKTRADFLWMHVLAKQTPPASGSDADTEAVREITSEAENTSIQLGPEFANFDEKWVAAEAAEKRGKDAFGELKNALRMAMGKSSYATIKGLGVKYSNKADVNGTRRLLRRVGPAPE